MVRHGWDGLGMVWHGSLGAAWHGGAMPGKAWLGLAGRGEAGN